MSTPPSDPSELATPTASAAPSAGAAPGATDGPDDTAAPRPVEHLYSGAPSPTVPQAVQPAASPVNIDPEHTANNAAAARTALSGWAVGIAVLCAALYIFIALAFGDIKPGAIVLVCIPAVLAALPLVLPAAARQRVALGYAVLLTALVVVSWADMGAFFVPLALVAWAVVVVPRRLTRPVSARTAAVWRWIGAAAVALPALLLAFGLASGTIGTELLVLLVIAAFAALAGVLGCGWRLAGPVIVATGAIIMVSAFASPGLLLLGVWWLGGWLIAVGLAAWVGRRARHRDPGLAPA